MNKKLQNTAPPTLLIIDDEPEVTLALERQFKRKYRVLKALSAQDALALLEKEPVQVIVSDQRMPDITGVEFFSMVKDRFPFTMRILLTGYADIQAVIDAINKGDVFKYIPKPWRNDDLEISVDEAFDRHALLEQNKLLTESLQQANSTLEQKVKQRTRSLEKANRRLEELNREKNQYIGMVAHDLRNPIGTSESFAGLLLESYQDYTVEEHRTFLDIIQKSCGYSLQLISDFLNISKIEAGVFELQLSSHEYIRFITDIIIQNNHIARKKNQVIHLNTSLNELYINIDANKMRQVVDNLLGNAMKYSPEESSIEVSVETDPEGLTTRVTDQGPGIAPAELRTLFHAYRTASSRPTGGEKATGLGLAIAKMVVDAHKGTIDVKSEPGKGSSFFFTLPLQV